MKIIYIVSALLMTLFYEDHLHCFMKINFIIIHIVNDIVL